MSRSDRGRPSATPAAADPEGLMQDAVAALIRRDEAAFQWTADQLTVHPSRTGGDAADRALLRSLCSAVTEAWRRGWQPADVVRFTERRLGRPAAVLVTGAIAAEMRAYSPATLTEAWAAQLTAVGAEVWWDGDDRYLQQWAGRESVIRPEAVAVALRVLHLLCTLPRLAPLGPLPGEGHRTGAPSSSGGGRGAEGRGSRDSASGNDGRRDGGAATGSRAGASGTRGAREDGRGAGPAAARAAEQRMLGRIRALLAKAESTEFPEEAEALSARAQELMARHSIDHALLAAESGSTEAPGGRRLAVDNPYEAPKAVLLNVVADANRCRAIWHKELGLATVLGFPADLDAVELMFTSLLVQANSAMMHSGAHQDARGRSRTRSFRHSFLSAYAQRIGERLTEAKDEAVRQAVAETPAGDLLPVLAARDDSVDRAVETMFPKLVRHRAGRINNYEGWVAGRAAADVASLTARSEVRGR